MKPFELDSHMVTLRGVFYPTGHVVLMFPSHDAAHEAAAAITRAGISGDEISLLSPDTLLGPIAQTVGASDMPFPSPGGEAAIVRQLAQHASRGEWGLMVHAPKSHQCEAVLSAVKGMPVTFAERYRHLVIEDLQA